MIYIVWIYMNFEKGRIPFIIRKMCTEEKKIDKLGNARRGRRIVSVWVVAMGGRHISISHAIM